MKTTKLIKIILSVIVVILTLFYPFAIYYGLNFFSLRYVAFSLAIIFYLRFIMSRVNNKMTFVTAGTGLVICIFAFLTNSSSIIKLYPFLVNMGLLSVFIISLIKPPSIIESIARIREPNLPAKAVIYTRNVTRVWCLFFIFNGIVSLLTALFASNEAWTLYNGFISYLLIAIIFSVEFTVRIIVKRRIYREV